MVASETTQLLVWAVAYSVFDGTAGFCIDGGVSSCACASVRSVGSHRLPKHAGLYTQRLKRQCPCTVLARVECKRSRNPDLCQHYYHAVTGTPFTDGQPSPPERMGRAVVDDSSLSNAPGVGPRVQPYVGTCGERSGIGLREDKHRIHSFHDMSVEQCCRERIKSGIYYLPRQKEKRGLLEGGGTNALYCLFIHVSHGHRC